MHSALYLENYEIYIDYLLECWRVKDFIRDANEFRDACDKGHKKLHDIINMYLLERSVGNESCKEERSVVEYGL